MGFNQPAEPNTHTHTHTTLISSLVQKKKQKTVTPTVPHFYHDDTVSALQTMILMVLNTLALRMRLTGSILRNTRVKRVQPVYEPEIIPDGGEMTSIIKNLPRVKVAEKCARDSAVWFHLSRRANTNTRRHPHLCGRGANSDTEGKYKLWQRAVPPNHVAQINSQLTFPAWRSPWWLPGWSGCPAGVCRWPGDAGADLSGRRFPCKDPSPGAPARQSGPSASPAAPAGFR